MPPETNSFYSELRGWQQSIGSLLGFFALMAAALWNFKLNRKRDRLLREEEAASVAAAIYGEILLLRRVVGKLARIVAKISMQYGPSTRQIDAHFLEAYPLPEPTLYKALAHKLGLLKPDLLLAITAFHRNYQETREALPLLIENKERGYTYGESWVLIPARDAVQKVLPSLREIERMLSIGEQAEELYLGEADFVIEIEEQGHL